MSGEIPFTPCIREEHPGAGLEYHDGVVFGAVDVWEHEGRRGITIHEWSSDVRGKGYSRRALEWMRSQGFEIIAANGVGRLDEIDGQLVGDIATYYWAHMHALGLVDLLFDDDGAELAVGPDESVTFKPQGDAQGRESAANDASRS